MTRRSRSHPTGTGSRFRLMATTSLTATPCTECAAQLDPDGVCLACAFREALASDPDEAESGGGPQFSEIADGGPTGRFGEYELRREVARGGMGVVYEAEDTRLSRSVALKMIRGYVFSSSSDRIRFRAEAGAAAHLDHPNIVPIYEIGEHQGQPFFTMKLINGGSLGDRLRDGPLPPGEAVALMTKVARAVHHAHLRGVLHRDLKPGNILLDSTGEPFLTDFGLAKLAEGDSGLTHSNALLGTPHYMSPEQAAGRTNDISTVSDVWALGVILYQMLSGRLPFNGSNSAEIVRRVVLTEAEPLTVFDSRAPSASNHGAEAKPATQRPSYSFTFLHRDLVTIVSRCLEKDPARRMHSAGFLADELNRFLLGEPVHSRPVSRVERWWKWARRHKTAVSAALTTGAALVAGASVSLWQAVRATHALKAAEASTERAEASAADAGRQLHDADAATRVMLDTISTLASSKSGRPLAREDLVSELVKRVDRFSGSPLSKSRLLTAVCEIAPGGDRLRLRSEALALASAHLDPTDPQLWNLRFDLARQQTSQNDHRSEGINALRSLLNAARKRGTAGNSQTVRALFALGKSHNNSTQKLEQEEAVRLLEELDRMVNQEPSAVSAANRISYKSEYAQALFSCDRREEALHLGRENIKFAAAQFGKDSFESGRALMRHAKLCVTANLDNEAAMTARQALEIFWKTSGPLGSDSGSALNMLLELRNARSDIEGVLALHRDAVREFDVQLGPSHKSTISRVAACARALIAVQRAKEADELNADWLKRIRLPDGTLGPEAEELLRAHVEVMKKRTDKARHETALRELISLIGKVRPQDLGRCAYESDLAELLIKQDRPDEAGQLLHAVITTLEEAADQKDKVVRVQLLLAKKRLEKAQEEKVKKATSPP